MVAQVVAPVLVVLLDHGGVGAVAAAGQDNALGGVDGDLGAVGLLSLGAHHAAGVVGQQGSGSGLGVDLHTLRLSGGLQCLHQSGTGGHRVGTGPHGTQHGEHAGAGVSAHGGVHADGGQPGEGIQSALGQSTGQVDVGGNPGAVIHLAEAAGVDVPHVEGHGVKAGHIHAGSLALVGGIEVGDVLLELLQDLSPLGEHIQLEGGVGGVQSQVAVQGVLLGLGEDHVGLGLGVHGVVGAAGHHGVAAQEGALLNQDDLGAVLRGADGGAEAGAAAAHHQDVGVPGLSLTGLGGVSVGVQGVHVQTGGLGGLLGGHHDAAAGKGSAGDGVQSGGLVLHNLLRNTLQSHVGHAGGLVALSQLHVGDDAVLHGHLNGDGALHTGRGAGEGTGDTTGGLSSLGGSRGGAGRLRRAGGAGRKAEHHGQAQDKSEQFLLHVCFPPYFIFMSAYVN